MKTIPTIAVKVPGVKVWLDGKPFIIPPLSLKSLKILGDRLKEFTGGANIESVNLVLDAAYLSLKRNYPDIEMDWLEDYIDLGNMQEVMQACMDVSGLKRKQQEEQDQGEANAANP